MGKYNFSAFLAYFANIDENTLSNSAIVQVQATDAVDLTNVHGISPDSDTYYIYEHLDKFRIDHQTGIITNKAKLDAELVSSYDFNIIAVDGAGNSVTCTVSISVDDLNDNYPIFDQNAYTVMAYDSVVAPNLLTVSATDKDSGVNAQIRFSLVNDFSSVFSIDPTTGVISMTSLDFDNMAVSKVYNLQVVATDQAFSPLSTTVNVGVTLKPINEFSPIFVSAPYFETIPEDTPLGSVLSTVVSATDADSPTTGDGVIEYYIEPRNEYFEVSASGKIIVSAELNYDEMIWPYEVILNIFAKDLGTEPGHKSTSTTYTITITNINDIYPTCDDYHLISVVFDDPSITSGNIATLSCSDSEDGSSIGYQVAEVNSDASYSGTPSFAMSGNRLTFSGGSLDYAILNFYYVKILLTDQPTNALNTTVGVSIYVNKSVSSDPVFTPSSYTFTIDENLNAGSLLGDVTTTTEGVNIVYTLVNSAEFSIDPINGKLYTAKSLDYELKNTYLVTVRAYIDKNEAGLAPGIVGYSDASVAVSVNDVNDNSPDFGSAAYSISVSEASISTLAITTSDADATAPNNVLTVSIDPAFNGGTESSSFVYGAGSLTINGDLGLDYDLGSRSYEIRLLAVDSGTPALTGTSTVFIEVLPENEFAPVWASGTIFSVSESALVGTTVGTATATDADASDSPDGTLRYTITTTNPSFSIGYTTGVVKSRTVLDYEASTTFSLTVLVSDMGSPLSSTTELITIVVTDENDEQMTCGASEESFFFQLAETASASGTIGTITCNGRDATGSMNNIGVTSYSVSSNVAWITASATGSTVTLSFIGPVDFEALTDVSYSVTLNLRDNNGNVGSFSTLQIFVDVEITNVNEVAPNLANLPIGINIDETLAIGTSIFNTTATDSDSDDFGNLRFYFTNGNSDGHYRIEEFSGEIKTAKTLDRESIGSYALEIAVKDGGGLETSAMLSVNLNDINDNPPVCNPSGQTVKIPENFTNADGALLTVVCSDEDTIVDSAANRVYSIVSTAPLDDFELDPVTRNELKVKSAVTLDYETSSKYTLVIHISDSGAVHTTTISLTISIDPVNEFDPMFSLTNYECNITENALVGDLACQVSADDLDSGLDGSIDLSIISGNRLGKFEIDSSSGELKILNSIDVDSFIPLTNPAVFELQVLARDRSQSLRRSATATVTINVYDVIDSMPECDYYITLELSELQTVPLTLIDLDTICSDTDVGEPPFSSYVIYAGNQDENFQMSGSNIELVKSLDYETKTYHNLTLRICDGQVLTGNNCVNIDLYLQVLPENECAPQFSMPPSGFYETSIPEDTSIGPLSFFLQASDCDRPTQAHGKIFFEMVNAANDSSEIFNVDKRTGEIILGGCVDYDFFPRKYGFEVRVFDNVINSSDSLSSVINVTINLLDVNDNRPIFNPATYVVNVIDNVTVGTVLKLLYAYDRDSGNNGTINYEMISEKHDNLFYMNGNQLTLSETLDADVQSNYKLLIRATDNAEPSYQLSSTALVSVVVTKQNDDPPEIVQRNGTILSFPENTPIGSLLLQIQASDLDSSATVFEFMIESVKSNRSNPIKPQYFLAHDTGHFYLATEFDYEDGKFDQIIISVSDGTNFQSLEFTIEIININEHPPFCDSTLLNIPVNENASKLVVSILERDNYVTDYDYVASGITNALKFKLLYSSAGDIFAIDPFTGASGNTGDNGRLELMNPILDFESELKQYSLIFEVSDEDYSPTPLTSTCNLKIFVQDINDNPPRFEPETIFVQFLEQTSASQGLKVSDIDAISTIAACWTNHPDFSVVMATKTLKFDLVDSFLTREYLGVLDNSRLD